MFTKLKQLIIDKKRYLETELNLLETFYIEARDNEKTSFDLFSDKEEEKSDPLPVYLTKSRIKSLNSAYLKTIRKEKPSTDDITDLLGLRVLSLFEQDLIEVYKFTLDTIFKNTKYKLNEVNFFGWDKNSEYNEYINNHKSLKLDSNKIKNEEKESGYKSIHLTGSVYHSPEESFNFEIQLRTLLQDVWAEMAHKLAYKQKGNFEYIKNSFLLLSRDLKTNDILLSQLKDYTDDKKCKQFEPKFNVISVFKYEDTRLPKSFSENEIIKGLYSKYTKLVYETGLIKDYEKIESVKAKYNELVERYKKLELKNDKSYNYWLKMENAFHNLLTNKKENIEKSKKTYEQYEESYVASFRLGQISIFEGDLTLAFRYFDNAKKIMQKDSIVKVNKLKVYINTALIFWNNGPDFLPVAIDEIEQALTIFQEVDTSKEDPYLKESIYNSACWYYMECSISKSCRELNKWSENNICLESKAQEYYDILVKIVKEEYEDKHTYAHTNTYDTLAWYNYQKYLLFPSTNKDFLIKSKEYIDSIYKSKESTLASRANSRLHNEHHETILCEYYKIYGSN